MKVVHIRSGTGKDNGRANKAEKVLVDKHTNMVLDGNRILNNECTTYVLDSINVARSFARIVKGVEHEIVQTPKGFF